MMTLKKKEAAALLLRLQEVRSQLETLKEEFENVLEAEQEAFDNLSEAAQESEKGQARQETIDALQDVFSDAETAFDCLESASGRFEEEVTK